jgi:DNA repair exonuclease SbcCD ATPase subunit
MTNDIDNTNDRIIDLDADEVVEQPRKDEPAASPPKPTAARKSSWPLLGAALVAGVIGGGFLYRDLLIDYFPSDQMRLVNERLAALDSETRSSQDRLASVDRLSAQLKNDVDSLEAKHETLAGVANAAQKANAATADKIAGVETALAETKQALSALAARPQPSDGTTLAPDPSALLVLQQRIDALEKDVASLKAKPAAPPDNTAELSQHLADLKAKIAAGQGYQEALTSLQTLVPAAAGLDALQQQATSGMPDAKSLAAELKALIPDLPKPLIPGPVPESEGWWAAIYDTLSGLITIRVEGDVDWPSAAAAAVALAEAGDLPQAIEQLNRIEGEKPPGISKWLSRAQARLGMEAALQSVEAAVSRVIAAKG